MLTIYLYRHRLKTEICQSIQDKIIALTQQNCNQLEQSSKIAEQTKKHQQEIIYYKQLTQLHEQNLLQKRELETAILDRAMATLTDVKASIWILIKAVGGKKDFIHHLDKQAVILKQMHDKVAELTYCFIEDKNFNSVDLAKTISNILLIYSKETFLLNLTINVEVSSNASIIVTDELLLRQVLANLFREAISFSRKNGVIDILVNVKMQNEQKELVVIIRDNGFGITSEYDEKSYCFLMPLAIDIEILKQFIQALKGDLTLDYIVDNGKTITLTLPIN